MGLSFGWGMVQPTNNKHQNYKLYKYKASFDIKLSSCSLISLSITYYMPYLSNIIDLIIRAEYWIQLKVMLRHRTSNRQLNLFNIQSCHNLALGNCPTHWQNLYLWIEYLQQKWKEYKIRTILTPSYQLLDFNWLKVEKDTKLPFTNYYGYIVLLRAILFMKLLKL